VAEVWHVVHSDDIRELLNRAHAGEDPDMVYLEWYANGRHADE
jgi:hypothetical protein